MPLIGAARASVAVRRLDPALAGKVRALARQVAGLNREIAKLDATIAPEFAKLNHRPADFQAGGVVGLATILAEAGDVARYPSAKQFLAHFGWCPAAAQIGKYKNARPRLSKEGNRYVRRMIWLLAVGAVRHPGPYGTTSCAARSPARTRWTPWWPSGARFWRPPTPS